MTRHRGDDPGEGRDGFFLGVADHGDQARLQILVFLQGRCLLLPHTFPLFLTFNISLGLGQQGRMQRRRIYL